MLGFVIGFMFIVWELLYLVFIDDMFMFYVVSEFLVRWEFFLERSCCKCFWGIVRVFLVNNGNDFFLIWWFVCVLCSSCLIEILGFYSMYKLFMLINNCFEFVM